MKSIPRLCSKTSLLIETDPYKTNARSQPYLQVKNIANIKISSSLSASILHLLNTIISIPLSQSAGSEEYWVLSLHIVKRNTQTTAYQALQLRETFPISAKFLQLWRHVGFVIKSIDVTLANHVIFWPRGTATRFEVKFALFSPRKKYVWKVWCRVKA